MIKNMIFDIGNVLLDFHPISFFKNYFDEETAVTVTNLIFHGKYWKMIDQGLMSEAEVMNILMKHHPVYAIEIKQAFREWKALLQPISYTLQLLEEAKRKGYHIYILSNIGEESFSYVKDKFEFFHQVDGILCSYDCHFIKPDVKIFEALFDKFQLLPGECMFIDDVKENIETGRKLGMKCILFDKEKKIDDEWKNFMEGNMSC